MYSETLCASYCTVPLRYSNYELESNYEDKKQGSVAKILEGQTRLKEIQ